MKYAITRRRITPDEPVMQCGFAARTHKSEGVHDDTWATLLLLQDDKRETAALISLDVLYGNRSFADGAKAALREHYGLTQVIINYSHTHGSVRLGGEPLNTEPQGQAGDTDGFPWTSGSMADSREMMVAYYRRVLQALLDMTDEGLHSLAAGRIALCRGQSRFGISRRYPLPDGSVAWRPYDSAKAMDPDLFLLKCEDMEGHLTALVYQYACHPTTLGSDNYLITADYPGVVRRILEENHPGLTTLFLQGCGADIKPRVTADGDRFKSCTYDEMETAAAGLAAEIEGYLAEDTWRGLDLDLAFSQDDIRLFAEAWRPQQWQALLENPDEPDYIKTAVRQHAASPEGRSPYFPFTVLVLRLDRQTCLVALENEMVNEIGKKIKHLFAQDLLVLGYSNSVTCYIPTRQILQQGGYEGDSFKRTNLTGPFTPETEDILIGRAAVRVNEMLNQS